MYNLPWSPAEAIRYEHDCDKILSCEFVVMFYEEYDYKLNYSGEPAAVIKRV